MSIAKEILKDLKTEQESAEWEYAPLLWRQGYLVAMKSAAALAKDMEDNPSVYQE